MAIFDLLKRKSRGLSAVVCSDLGCERENNEDNYLLGAYMNSESADKSEAKIFLRGGDKPCIAAVFDGMGGGESGELASKAAAESLSPAAEGLSPMSDKKEIDGCIRKAFLEANRRILELRSDGRISGSTGTVLCIFGGEFKIYHLGDSRAYLVREGRLYQLSRDHTLARMKLEMGLYEADDPRIEAEKHQLTEFLGCDKSAVGLRPEESEWMPLQRGDRLLLCSDGLYDMCADECIAGILAGARNVGEAVAELVDKAKENGGVDNVTCLAAWLT